MNYEEYTILAARTEKLPADGIDIVLTRQQYRLIHGAIGVAGELMEELIPAVASYVYATSRNLPRDQVRSVRINLIEELGDIMWYLSVIRNAYPAVTISLYHPEGNPENETMQMRVESLAAHLGALVDIVKRRIIYGKPIDDNKLASAHYNAIRYVEALALGANHTLDGVMQLNIDKLKKRYPNNYTDHDALARADKKDENNAHA